jgi:hypothetical protein
MELLYWGGAHQGPLPLKKWTEKNMTTGDKRSDPQSRTPEEDVTLEKTVPQRGLTARSC